MMAKTAKTYRSAKTKHYVVLGNKTACKLQILILFFECLFTTREFMNVNTLRPSSSNTSDLF
jgi:hypothetical protein